MIFITLVELRGISMTKMSILINFKISIKIRDLKHLKTLPMNQNKQILH